MLPGHAFDLRFIFLFDFLKRSWIYLNVDWSKETITFSWCHSFFIVPRSFLFLHQFTRSPLTTWRFSAEFLFVPTFLSLSTFSPLAPLLALIYITATWISCTNRSSCNTSARIHPIGNYRTPDSQPWSENRPISIYSGATYHKVLVISSCSNYILVFNLPSVLFPLATCMDGKLTISSPYPNDRTAAALYGSLLWLTSKTFPPSDYFIANAHYYSLCKSFIFERLL